MVKLRLCPFAEAVFNTSSGVRYVVSPAVTTDEVWREFLREVDHLVNHDRQVRVVHSICMLVSVVCCKVIAVALIGRLVGCLYA